MGSACTGCRCYSRAIFIRELKTCATISKLTRNQCSSTHDLPPFFVYSRHHRRGVSRYSGSAWLDETGLRASGETVSALSGRRSCAAHDLPGLDFLVGGHHPDGRIFQLSSAASYCVASRLRTHAVFRG